jgi:hypothetical protein
MNESRTRAEIIDPALLAAGWGVVEGSRILREHGITLGRIEGHGRRGKPLTADYVLVFRNRKLAVVEAKAYNEELTEGVAQAKNYADKLSARYTYATNGRGIYGIDMTEGTEGELPRYPTPDELWNMTFAEPNVWRDRFAAVSFPDKSGSWSLRFYQEIAVSRVLEQIEGNRDRILLTLATGTGKTSIAFQIAWKLFQEALFGRLPEFFKDEAELRALWSNPDTRAKLLQGLAEKGFGPDQMGEMQRVIEAEKSDLFDVLANVAYALPPVTREERAAQARIPISAHFNVKQQAFLDFVLSQYVQVGVGELDREKLSPLLRLKYNNAIADAIADLGRPEEIGRVFSGFQKYLYMQGSDFRLGS